MPDATTAAYSQTAQQKTTSNVGSDAAERVRAEILRLRAQDVSFTEIGNRLGVSRNVVAGVIHRAKCNGFVHHAKPGAGYKTDPITGRQIRGFAGMSPERRQQIAAKGGASVASHNRSFSKNRDLASEAGTLGGKNSRGGGRPRKTVEA